MAAITNPPAVQRKTETKTPATSETAPTPQPEALSPPVPVAPPVENAPPPTIPVTVKDGATLGIELAEDIPVTAEAGRPLKFATTSELRIGGVLLVAKGALVKGQIVEGAQKKFLRSTKTTLRLLEVEVAGGQKIPVRSLSGRRPDGKYELPVDPPVKPKSKDVVAQIGTPFVAYVDGDHTLHVPK